MRLSVARALVIVLVLMVDAASVFAQVPEDDEPVRRWQFGVGATLAMPVGDFSKHVDASPGFYLQLDRRVAKSPVSLGGDFAYIQYGETHRTVSLDQLVPEIPGAQLKVETTNAMYLVHARARAQRQRGRSRPYVDGVVGLTVLVTESSIPGVANCFVDDGSTTCIDTTAASATNAAQTRAKLWRRRRYSVQILVEPGLD